jgi:hypothetical protein
MFTFPALDLSSHSAYQATSIVIFVGHLSEAGSIRRRIVG